jgi:hypothetical protein
MLTQNGGVDRRTVEIRLLNQIARAGKSRNEAGFPLVARCKFDPEEAY